MSDPRPTVLRQNGAGHYVPTALADFGALDLGPYPVQTMRVLGLVRAGTSWGKLLEIGRYETAWTERDVRRILAANQVTMPDMPDAHGTRTARLLPLNDRQLKVAAAVVRAWTNTEIAAYLHVPESTVKSDVRHIIAASESRDRIGFVVEVLNRRLRPCPASEASGAA